MGFETLFQATWEPACSWILLDEDKSCLGHGVSSQQWKPYLRQ
ncbi:rCG55380 [Rattus norvegicus]|uniref:RCG55380 n=1 Tax=Rattus norvegicus TaxID=10116 RepID=A6JQK0_RAT|nr:rCG55380 [Rattus norvegicus]